MGKFKDDIKIGNSAENHFIELAKEHNLSCSKSPKGCKEYDVEIKGIKFEIKYDVYSKKSGNIAIEFYNPKKGVASGVSISSANYWIYFLGTLDKAYYISILHLKDLMNTKPLRVIESGGNDNASLMLFKIDSVIHLFTPLEELWHFLSELNCS